MRNSVCIMNEIVNLNEQVQRISSKMAGPFSISGLREHCQYWDNMEQESGGRSKLRWRIKFEAFEDSGFSSSITTKSFEIDGIENDSLILSRNVSCVLRSLSEALEIERSRRLTRIDELTLDLKEALERESNESL